MAYFPFFIDIEDQDCLIAGGGMVALRKVEVLLPYGPRITVISPEIEPEIEALAAGGFEGAGRQETAACGPGQAGRPESGTGQIILKRRHFSMEDLNGRDFVIAATDDEELNRRISHACRARRIPVNVVDVKEECSFIFPSIVREGDIVVGISSGGKSPTVTQYLKNQVRQGIPAGYGRLVEQLGDYRDFVKERVPDVSCRTVIFKRMVDVGRENGCQLDDRLVEELIKQVTEERE